MVAILRFVVRAAFLLVVFVAGCFWARARADEVSFDAWKRGPYRVTVVDMELHDRARSLPVRIYLPDGLTSPAPVVVFSHGLGNSREGYSYLGEQWASHGYASVHPEHPGASHDLDRKGLLALYRAGKDTSYWASYPKDISFVLYALQQSSVASRLDLQHVVVAGHSLGAYAVLALAGLRVGTTTYRDPRIVAGIPISMSEPFSGDAYKEIAIPLLHITGTHDSSLVYGTLPSARRVPFENIHAPGQTLVTITGANHSTFSDDESPGNRRAHDIIRGATTAFLDATLRHDPAAAAWLRDGLPAFAGADARVERRDVRIGAIHIEAISLFSDEELSGGTVYRALNHLHTRTHDDLVRRMLMIHEGDAFDPSLLPEIEKNLRRLDFIKMASVTASEPHDGVVDITVRTQDEWTTDPNIDLGHSSSGVGTWAINVTQKDLLGTGAEVSVTDARTAERSMQTLEFLDPVFIRPYWNLETLIGRNSDGGERRVLLEQPFYSQYATSSFSILADSRTLDEKLFANGIAVTRFHARKDTWQAMFGRALTTGAAGSQRVYAGLESASSTFGTVVPNAFVPDSYRDRFIVVGYGFTRTTPVKLDYVDHDAKFDDFTSGVETTLFAGFGREEQEVRASIAHGLLLGDRGLLLANMSLSTRLRDGAENEIGAADMRFVWRFHSNHPAVFVTRLRVEDGRELNGDVQFYADAERGLRGYPNFAFAGTRAFVFNAEQRFFLGRELLHLFAPGVAFFVDSGDAVNRGVLHPHTDVGAGLRFSLNRADSTVLRIDVAHDLAPAPNGQKRWAVSIGTSQAF